MEEAEIIEAPKIKGEIKGETETESEAEIETETVANESTRPEWLAEKFWDEEKGEARVEVLASSYAQLEKHFGTDGLSVGKIPASAQEYNIKLGDIDTPVDAEIAERLFEAGFTREQAQVVYDLGVEQLAPAVMGLAADAEGERQINKLENHFGGRERWFETARQINAWGSANLAIETFDTLSSTYDGVIAMHQMMGANEPQVIGRAGSAPTGTSESELRQLMKDPRYWRERDPGVVAQVRGGYEKLYPAS